MRKILFIDRDGTLIAEPDDKQIDNINKLLFMPDVIASLSALSSAGYSLVMISNQDGLGTASFPKKDFNIPHEFMLRVFETQGIKFEGVRICPHLPIDNCECRKPKLGLVLDYLTEQSIDRKLSFVIGDRDTDMQLAENMGIRGLHFGQMGAFSWKEITDKILLQARVASVIRKTKETNINIEINLDNPGVIKVNTGIGFFDHMLEQLAKHGGFSLVLSVIGDLEIDEHHTVEDTAIALGEGIRKALGDKWGIGRYGFLLPMDESLAEVAIDLSGRSYFVFKGEFQRERVGDLATELIAHFFRSFAGGLKATLHIEVKGENTHHMIESIFKAVGRTLRSAFTKIDNAVPSTKGVL